MLVVMSSFVLFFFIIIVNDIETYDSVAIT